MAKARSSRTDVLTPRQVRLIARALSEPRRFEMLKRIASLPCMACTDLRASFPLTPATVSHHMKELEAAGLIKTERVGKFVEAKFCRQIWEAYLAELGKL